MTKEKFSRLVNTRSWFIGEMAALFIIVAIIYTVFTASYMRWPFMILAFIYLIFVQKNIGLSIQETKFFTRRNLEDTGRMIILSLLIVSIGFLLHYFFPFMFNMPYAIKQLKGMSFILGAIGYAIISVIMQEFMFRGYIIGRLSRYINNTQAVIIISAGIFSLAHFPFGSPYFLLGTFLVGYWWSWEYLRSRNLYPIICSHTLLGIAAGILVFM